MSSESGASSGPSQPASPRRNGAGSRLALAAALAGSIIALLAVLKAYDIDARELPKYLEAWVATAGPAGPVLFAVAYALAAVLFLPASLFTLLAGYLYGPLLGTAVVSVGATAGATLAFLTARYIARPLVESRLAGQERFVAIDRAIGREGGKIVLLLRLSPLFPYNLLNYVLGLTTVELLPYFGATFVGMLPGGFAYVYLGSVGRQTLDAAGGGAWDPAKLVLYGLGAVATIWVTKVIAGIAGKALQEASGDD